MADAPEIEALTPYARSLGISLDRWEDGTPILTVPFDETVEGRPDHYHGGATGGLPYCARNWHGRIASPCSSRST